MPTALCRCGHDERCHVKNIRHGRVFGIPDANFREACHLCDCLNFKPEARTRVADKVS